MAAKRYELRHFVADFEATEWINSMDALGYEVVSMATCEVQNGRDRRERDVQITVLMRLTRITGLTPGTRMSEMPAVPNPCSAPPMYLPYQEPATPNIAPPLRFSYAAGPQAGFVTATALQEAA